MFPVVGVGQVDGGGVLVPSLPPPHAANSAVVSARNIIWIFAMTLLPGGTYSVESIAKIVHFLFRTGVR